MNDTISEALKEAYASAPSDVVYLQTIELSHPNIDDPIRLVTDRVDHTFTLEDGTTTALFEAAAFAMSLPASGDNGVQQLNIQIDNVDERVSDFITSVEDSILPVKCIMRPYLANDPTTCQQIPPLTLFLSDITVNEITATGKATFADILNKAYPTEYYTRARFPSLGN